VRQRLSADHAAPCMLKRQPCCRGAWRQTSKRAGWQRPVDWRRSGSGSAYSEPTQPRDAARGCTQDMLTATTASGADAAC
jgi:hypothetical protein